VFRVDAGSSPLARPPLAGAAAVARQVVDRGSRFAPLGRPGLVNGAAGVIVGPSRRPRAVVGFTVAGGRIAAIDLILDPEKLRRLAIG
jgi:RNA polymerase sigma-70 factor (ECF subfamily)